MNDNQVKFQNLLRELFQFDCADLDFGIYRIMNYKRAVIERFITEDLPKAIAEELEQGALAEQAKVQEALAAARQKVLKALRDDALDAEGNLAEQYRESNVGKEYLEAQQRAQGSRSREALEAAIYNHLYAFFSRYWQDGDFISKRRYSKKERYAIPYNGEEVYLYWANHDQYYIKTGEYFTDYAYKAPNGVTVHFKLRQADVEQNNVKGEKRFFLPRLDEIVWDEAAQQLTIPFEYRPLTEQKTIANVAEITERVKADKALDALTAERRRTEKGETVTYLEHHLRQYTRRNTSDFFIHKDLKGFLSRELDFYLKNEVLNLEEMEAAGEHLAQGWFQLLRLIKRIGLRIIEFLAQIEDFQKMLWEKKKFVTEVFYLVRVGHVPQAFYAEIAACEAQWDEWKTLFAIDEEQPDLLTSGKTKKERRVAFLKAHPTLVLDTRRFPADFTDRLLASFDNLDEMTDGLLVHSENWQALNLLQEKYRERVKCIYIDPPYNTGTDEFIYKDEYQTSSWLSFLLDRTTLARNFLAEKGVFFYSIDDNEESRFHVLIEHIFGASNVLPTVVVRRRKSQPNLRKGVAPVHDYLKIACRNYATMSRLSYVPDEFGIGTFSNPDNDPRGPWTTGPCSNRGGSRYKIVTPAGIEYDDEWRFTEETYRNLLQQGRIYFPDSGRGKPRYKIYLSEKKDQGIVASTWWDDVGDTQSSHKLLEEIFGRRPFENPKALEMLRRILDVSTSGNNVDHILDYFAGSGTTGHAVINLNREDGGRRKFILVEMAQYFDTVLLPRIKKVTFTPEWKDGKPKRMATQEEAERSPRIVKVIRLESYEDALNNLTFDEESGQQALELFRDDYLLSYMLKWETRHSETLLNVEKLQSPFSYKLHIHRDGETRERTVDLPETFNYLLGLDVHTRRVYDDEGRRYLVYRGTLRNSRTVAVIWRDTKDWKEKDYRCERNFVEKQKLVEGADEIYTNGDSIIPGARSLDGLFKARMFAPVEV